MKKLLAIGLFFACTANIAQARQTPATPYYMKNTDHTKADAIKTNQASSGCGCCSGAEDIKIFTNDAVSLKNAQARKDAYKPALITIIAAQKN